MFKKFCYTLKKGLQFYWKRASDLIFCVYSQYLIVQEFRFFRKKLCVLSLKLCVNSQKLREPKGILYYNSYNSYVNWIKIRFSGYWNKVVKQTTGIINAYELYWCTGIFAIAKDDALLKFHRLPFMDSELVHKTQVFALSFEMKSLCYTQICNFFPRYIWLQSSPQKNISLKDIAVQLLSHFLQHIASELSSSFARDFQKKIAGL